MTNVKKDTTAKRATITLHTSPDVKRRLAQLSQTTDRSSSYLAAEAIKRYLSEEEEFIAAVKEGLSDIEAGRVFTADQVRASLVKRFRS